MSSSTHNSRHSTTIINIHSPEDEQLPIEENDTSRRASSASRQPPKPSPKVDEYRKMIRHIVSKIVKRKRPPTALFRLSELCRTTEVSDLFENDDTIDLLIQLRSALMVCHQVGLSTQVLLQGERSPSNSPVSSRSNSPTPSPRTGSPSKSPENLYSGISHSKNDKRSEFDTILYVLSDLILNDSRYKTANPKPSRPPYTMQAILIDLAILLVQIRDDSSGLYHIGTVFMPAFESFSEGTMLRRLLSFYLDNLLPKLIKCKDEPKSKSNESRKSLKAESSKPIRSKKSNNPNTPTINIHSPEPDRSDTPVKTSHLTIDTRPLTVEAASHSSPVSPAAYSTNNNTLDAYHAYALFTPLLFFMIQYLDPYLAAQPTKAQQENFTYTLTRQASLIHNFHKALTYMMSCKPDLYLDLLDIISRSTPEVKFRACQILFNYYFVSVGHIVVADPLPVLGTKEELEVLDQHRLQQELEEEHQKNHQHGNRTQQHRPIRKTTHIVSENSVEDHHIWYPHMFAEHDKVSKILANNPFSFGIHRDTTESYCKECFKSIQGCGLRCFQCKSNVHYNCFNSKSHFDGQNMLFYLKAGGIQKVLTPQYCVVPPQPRFRDMVDCGILGWNAKSSSAQVGLLGHMFRLVNIYTIVVCACCGLPLWGVSLQGYQCSQCNRFVHPQCLVDAEEKNSFLKIKSSKASTPHSFQTCVPQSPLLETDIKISQADLNKSLSDFYGDALPLNKESLEGRSFEEASLMLDVFLMQEAILHCGVASGCIIITNESDHPLLFTPSPSVEASNLPENFSNHSSSLSQAINVYTSYLDSEDYQSSAFFKDFFGHSDASTIKHLLSKEEFLCHLAAMMKSLTTSFGSTMTGTPTADKRRSAGDSRGFLQVSPNPFTSAGWEEDEESEFDEGHTPNENLDRSMLLSWVMTNLNFRNRKAAEILLQHMHNLGLFERFDASPFLFLSSTIEQEPAVQCVFPVPFAIDFSANVEILINSIEACMRDIDLSINECGLLLLVRRCWPDPFMSGYSRERLIHAIIAWTFDEDERLLALHAEITSVNRHSSLHHAKQQKKWAQAALLARMKGQNISERNRQSTFQLNTAAGVSSGASNMYVTTRTGLKDRYVLRWMSAVHKMDPEAYTDILFNAVEEIIDSKKEKCAIPNWEESSDVKNHVLQKYELFINYITKLKNNGLMFSSMDAILEKWFEKTYTEFEILGILKDKEPVELRNLVKLCSSKTLNAKQPGTLSTNSVHPIDLIVSQFQGKQGSDRGIRWLTLAAHSGVTIPVAFLSHLSKVLVSVQLPLDIMVSFVEIVWYQVVHIPLFATQRAAIAEIVGYLNQSNADILASMNDNSSLPDESLIHVQDFVKYSAALACFAYGCSPNEVIEAGIVPYVGDHASKASQNKRTSTPVDFSMIEIDENTHIIESMLSYLQYDRLNLREDVIRMFYCLTQWGHCIGNKEEFITGCIPKLIPAVWELLVPAYDHISNINLNLLMQLISVDVRYFQACVFKIFEDNNWEVRYQGLDHLFGLFTKMDAAFQTEWLKLLSKLGPVFSYFVSCLWDKEEYVRSKAFALIRSFGTLHLRSAFRCWEAYFLTATDRQKMSLVSLMTQLNALFPDWPVLQWESLLEALELKTPVDVLDEYTRSSLDDEFMIKNSTNSSEQHSAESENVQVLMLTLALQMLSNHLNIEPTQLYRLKFVLVQQMNFQDCHYFNEGGDITITFGPLKYEPSDPSRVAAMISCTRGLKKIMDSFAPLPAETVASIASDSIEQNKINLAENSSPGVHFIDVVLKMMNSGIDLTKLGHMMLKAWLEIVLIVIYKHNILEREYEQSVVTCMKQIIEILTEEISDENKLIILEVLKCLLRRSDHLTAMVLSKQILTLGKLMTKLGNRNLEPVYLKAKQFLKSAFLRFAVAGLFVLMFKNQAVSDANSGDVDLFFVLRTVIDPDDVIPDEDFRGEIVYLRDQPVRDVLEKLMKQQMERKAFSTVLYNVSRYVETVHTHPYSENILHDYAGFLNALIKHTSEWRRSDWNINPIFTMSAILLKKHPYHHLVLLPPTQAILKYGLSNCTIQADSVVKLIAAYSTTTMSNIQPGYSNAFAGIIVEEIKNTLSSITRPNKDTLLVLLQIVLWDTKPAGQEWYSKIEASILGQQAKHSSYFEDKLLDLLPLFVNYLKRACTSQQFTRKDFKVYSSIAQLIVSIVSKDPKLTVIIFGYLKLEEGIECLRFLNWFILTLLKEQADVLLAEMIGYETVLTELFVRTFNTAEVDFHVPDLNFSFSPSSEKLLLCFLLLKAYVLLKLRNRVVSTDKPHSIDSPTFWMAVWPALRRLLDMIETSSLFMAGNVGLSIWNMFLSLLQFLLASRNEIAMINAYEWHDLLSDLLQKVRNESQQMHQDTAGMEHLVALDEFQKRVQKFKDMFDIPPVQVPFTTMIDQLFLELRDVMRLQAESITVQSNNRALMQTMGSNF